MKKIRPRNLEGTFVEPVWNEIFKIGQSQGVNPTLGPVVMQDLSPQLRRTIDKLAAAGGAEISQRDTNTIEVNLAFDDEIDQQIVSAPPRASAKPNTNA